MIDVIGVPPLGAESSTAALPGADPSLPALWVVGRLSGAPVAQGLIAMCRELSIEPPTELTQPSPQQLLEALHRAPQALVLLDPAWANQQDESVLRALRRHAAGRVLLLWTDPHTQWLDLVVRCDARGAIDVPNMPRDLMVRALRAVSEGWMWFPRAFMQQLYEALCRRLEIGRSNGETVAVEQAASEAEDGSPSPLTRREYQVFQLMRSGQSNKQIAAHLAISVNTVKKHLASAFSKTGLRHRRQALI